MELSLLQYYQNRDISLLKQFILTIPIFSQMYYYLSKEKFNQFIQSIQVNQVNYSIPYELNARSAYLFLSTGILISKKQKKQNYQKLSRLSRNVRFSQIMMSRDMLTQSVQRQSQKIKQVQSYQLYNENLLYNPHFTGNNQYFISNQQKKSAIIAINLKKVSQNSLNEVRQKHNQKLKIISNCHIFKNVQKGILQSNLNKFKVLKVTFDQFVIKRPSLRSNCVIFLTSGQVEILSDNVSHKKTFLTKAPAIIGLENVKYVKSVTQSAMCYYVQKNDIVDMLKKNMQGRYKNTENEQQLKHIMKSLGKQKSLVNSQNLLPGLTPRVPQLQDKELRQERSNTTPVSPVNLQSESFMFKSKQNLLRVVNQRVSENKVFRIKQHFTNFMNDKYSQFASRKTQFLKKKSENEDSVLYEMKSLVSKQPQMSFINKRLKIERLKKIQKCKQNIQLTKQQSLNSVNLRIYQEFQDIRILNKIRHKIQRNIEKKQRKNQHWKTYVPNNSSFNRMSDLSVGV